MEKFSDHIFGKQGISKGRGDFAASQQRNRESTMASTLAGCGKSRSEARRSAGILLASVEFKGVAGWKPAPQRGSEDFFRSLVGRRELLRAGLGSSLSLLKGLATGGKTSLASQKVDEAGKRMPQHRIIDVHCHPRWIGYDGARMIEKC